MSQLELFLSVIKILDQLQIPYFVTGSWASSYYGQPRSTHDIDLVVHIHKRDIKKFLEGFKGDRYVLDGDMIEEALRHHTNFQLTDLETGFWVDFWVLKPDNWSQSCWNRRQGREFQGQLIYFPSPEDVILSKLQWSKISGGSERQLNDVRSILQIQQNLDLTYLRRWAKALNVINDLEILIQEIRI